MPEVGTRRANRGVAGVFDSTRERMATMTKPTTQIMIRSPSAATWLLPAVALPGAGRPAVVTVPLQPAIFLGHGAGPRPRASGSLQGAGPGRRGRNTDLETELREYPSRLEDTHSESPEARPEVRTRPRVCDSQGLA